MSTEPLGMKDDQSTTEMVLTSVAVPSIGKQPSKSFLMLRAIKELGIDALPSREVVLRKVKFVGLISASLAGIGGLVFLLMNIAPWIAGVMGGLFGGAVLLGALGELYRDYVKPVIEKIQNKKEEILRRGF